MGPETHNCQNCKAAFVIEPEDFQFYAKISVPSPSWCPDCRAVRRMIFRNERTLYKRACDLCGASIVAMYPAAAAFPVYCHDCWWSDKWDSLAYGRPYDFTKPFFAQFAELRNAVPRVAVEAYQNKDSPFTNFTWFSKNVYLSSSALYAENAFNAPVSWRSVDTFDSYQVYHGNRCYETVNSYRCSNVKYVVQSKDCLDSAFLFDCRNCTNCFMSSNLRNRSYIFRNRQLTQDAYVAEMAKIEMRSRAVTTALIDEFRLLKKSSIHRFASMINTVQSTGDNLTDTKNAYNCFNAEKVENVRHGTQMDQIRDSADLYGAGDNADLLYEGTNVGYHDSGVFFSTNTFDGDRNVQYSDYCRQSCINVFGCVGLRKKQYCILNKEYSKEEYGSLLPKIIEHMNVMPYIDKAGRRYEYGEFFPPELSPFAYNETIAQSYFPITESEAIARNYPWRRRDKTAYDITITAEQFPDSLLGTDESITTQIIECVHRGQCNHQCTNAFRVLFEELQFHRMIGVTLSPLCLNCRFETRLEHRSAVRLWHRQCHCNVGRYENSARKNTATHFHDDKPCPVEFETSYAPDRPEIVYCESCYNAEVA